MKKCIIMRGLPGSGKTLHVRQNCRNATIFSTDDYFIVDGAYRFDQTKLAEYHNKNLRRFIGYLDQNDYGSVVIDNTNVRLFELAPYYRIAEVFGWDVEIVWIQADIEKCVARNTHGVPEATIRTMANSFEPIPPWWKQRIVVNS
jgi:predicted kinase